MLAPVAKGVSNVFMPDPDDKIRVSCPCGAKLAAPARLEGKLIKCPKCRQPVHVGAVASEADLDFRPLPEPESEPPLPSPAAPTGFRVIPEEPPEGAKKYARWVLVAALLPLIISVFSKDDSEAREERTRVENAELFTKLEADVEAGKIHDLQELRTRLFSGLPGNRFKGAHVSRFSSIHWVYAIFSALAFWGFILLAFPMGKATSPQLWKVGVFIGTAGIFLLLAFQWIAMWTQNFNIMGRSILVVIFYIAKFVGYSYRAALDPENSFVLSMMGFTLGVGLCEEVCKALPLLLHFKGKATLDVRGAVVWGLAAGIGFGVSEGITYSSDYYNGISTAGIYVVRFISCVALHAVWSATAGLFLWRYQEQLQGMDEWYDVFKPVFWSLGTSMVLHGFYDTFLKKEMEVAALLTALASFALFFLLYDRYRAQEASLPGWATQS